MITGLVILLLQDQATQQDIEKAMQQDKAAQSQQQQAQPAAPAPAPAPAAPVTPLPGNTAEQLTAAPTQLAAQRPGATLLNPAVSVILDGDFGYYGVHAGDFAAAGLPLAGDDPHSDAFGMQEIEVAFQSAIDPYLEGA